MTTASETIQRSTPQRAVRPGDRALQVAALFFAVGAVVHNYDHFRRGSGAISTELRLVGTAGIVLTVLLIVVALARFPFAPQAAAVGGLVLAIGFTGAHWLPTWSVLSDSFVEGDAATLSQVASLVEIAGALALAATGYYAIRARRSTERGGRLARTPAQIT